MITDPLRLTLYRNLVKACAGTAMTCPHCGDVLDCTRTVAVWSPGDTSTWLGCAKCWGKGPFTLTPEGRGWTVLDGRSLFPPARRRLRRSRSKEVHRG